MPSKSLPLERNQDDDLLITCPQGANLWLAGCAAGLPYARMRLTVHSEEANAHHEPGTTRLMKRQFGRQIVDEGDCCGALLPQFTFRALTPLVCHSSSEL